MPELASNRSVPFLTMRPFYFHWLVLDETPWELGQKDEQHSSSHSAHDNGNIGGEARGGRLPHRFWRQTKILRPSEVKKD